MVTLLACIFVFGILVSVHEFGHFITAKLTGMRVDEFAIGFGPKLFSHQGKETLYSLRAIPLGGYNKIYGMEPGEECDDRGFNSKTVPRRMLVILAGSMMNFILPMVIFSGLFMFSGVDMPVKEPVFGEVLQEYPAAKAGMLAGDKVLQVNGKPVATWEELRAGIMAADGKDIPILVDRGGEEKTFHMTAVTNPETGKPFIGVVAALHKVQLGPVDSVKLAVRATVNMVQRMYAALYHIFTGNSSAELAGPVGVAKMTGQVAQQGIAMLLQFTAMLSLNLAIINLLPLPALDGGHFVLLLWEGITGRKLGKKVLLNIQTAGVIMILTITILATFHDLTR